MPSFQERILQGGYCHFTQCLTHCILRKLNLILQKWPELGEEKLFSLLITFINVELQSIIEHMPGYEHLKMIPGLHS